MAYYQEQIYNKPVHFEDNDLIAMLGIYDVPKVIRPLGTHTYTKSELAVNEKDNLVQVYVLSDTPKGLEDFQEDYPNAIIKDDATLSDPQNWKVLAFSTEIMPDESTPLDNYFQGRTKNLIGEQKQ